MRQPVNQRQGTDLNRAFAAYQADPDERTMEAAIEAGRPLVLHFALAYGTGCAMDDLVQSGMLGLMEAVSRYDGQVQFSTWASWCIISEIRHYVRRERAYRSPVVSGSGDAGARPDETEGPFSLGIENALAGSSVAPQLPIEERLALQQALEKLSEPERQVINALFYRGLTQQQTANEMGLSQRKVSRVKASAIQRLGALLEAPSFHLVDTKESFHLLSGSSAGHSRKNRRKAGA